MNVESGTSLAYRTSNSRFLCVCRESRAGVSYSMSNTESCCYTCPCHMRGGGVRRRSRLRRYDGHTSTRHPDSWWVKVSIDTVPTMLNGSLYYSLTVELRENPAMGGGIIMRNGSGLDEREDDEELCSNSSSSVQSNSVRGSSSEAAVSHTSSNTGETTIGATIRVHVS